VAHQIIINNVMTSEDCEFCRTRKAAQLPYLQQVHHNFSLFNTVEVPLFAAEIKGLEALNQLKRHLFGEIPVKP